MPSREQSDFSLSFDALGLTVTSRHCKPASVNAIGWNEIVRVTAFKRDFFTWDCICLGIHTVDGMATEVNEELDGWQTLTRDLQKHLVGCKHWSEWFPQVAFPAFATNETVLFERQSEERKCCAE